MHANILPFSRNLISYAHHHHEIEDYSYFPQFALLYPELNRALSLLDSDHRVVNDSLSHTQTALDRLESGSVTRDELAEVHAGSKGLEKILNRHIWDEEEVIIPIFLKHA